MYWTLFLILACIKMGTLSSLGNSRCETPSPIIFLNCCDLLTNLPFFPFPFLWNVDPKYSTSFIFSVMSQLHLLIYTHVVFWFFLLWPPFSPLLPTHNSTSLLPLKTDHNFIWKCQGSCSLVKLHPSICPSPYRTRRGCWFPAAHWSSHHCLTTLINVL